MEKVVFEQSPIYLWAGLPFTYDYPIFTIFVRTVVWYEYISGIRVIYLNFRKP